MLRNKDQVARVASLKLFDETKAPTKRKAPRIVLVNDREDTRIARWHARRDFGQHGVDQYVADSITVRESLSLPLARDGCEMNFCFWHLVEGVRAEKLTFM